MHTTIYLRLEATRQPDGTVLGVRSGIFTRTPPALPVAGAVLVRLELDLPDYAFDADANLERALVVKVANDSLLGAYAVPARPPA